MKKTIFLVLISILLCNFASAADVAYIVSQSKEIKQIFLDTLEELNYDYDIIFSYELNSANFDNYRMILVNNDYFFNWEDIPINDYPAVIVNGRNIDNWGWTRRITSASSTEPIKVNFEVCENLEICNGLSGNKSVYSSYLPQIYYLDKTDVFDGITIIGANLRDSGDIVIGAVEAGTTLTKPGYSPTYVNANSVFFGVTESSYWTAETKDLFKNSIKWAIGEKPDISFDIELEPGYNLISIPLEIESNDIENILYDNPEISSVFGYEDEVVQVYEMFNNKGYFLNSSQNSILEIIGQPPQGLQKTILQEGMNLVGINSLEEISLDELPEEIIEVSKRNGQNYEIATKYNGVWYNSFNLIPGKGYWFKVNEEVEWSYTGGNS